MTSKHSLVAATAAFALALAGSSLARKSESPYGSGDTNLSVIAGVAPAQQKKPTITMLVSDDTGWGDFGSYGGGVGRGMPTPSLDRMAREGMQFWSFYGQPSCTPGRAAIQTGRFPNRSLMTTVASFT